MPENELLSKNFHTHSIISGSFCSLLTVIFVLLKLDPGGHLTCRVAEWSWWWVFSPLWVPSAVALCLVAVIFVGAIIVASIAALIAAIFGK